MRDDPARSTPAGFWRFSANYLLAARATRARLDLDGALLFPTLHLYGLSIELGLKAFLLKRGNSLSDIRKLSHHLSKVLALARRRKLSNVVSLTRFDLAAIRVLDISYSSNELRYIVIGATKVPTVNHLAGVAERLTVELEPFCTGQRRFR
jgi:hypothetical protein